MMDGQTPKDLSTKGSTFPDEYLHSPTCLWAVLDPGSQSLRSNLGETIDSLLDSGTNVVGFQGDKDALALPGWEEPIRWFLETGFRCLLSSSFPLSLDPAQASLLARIEEIWVPSEVRDEPTVLASLRLITEAANQLEILSPRIVRMAMSPAFPGPQPLGFTRDCTDPWEGIVLREGDGTSPCAFDACSIGDHRKSSLPSILNGPAILQRRKELLSGELPKVCQRCTRYPWVPLTALQDQVAAHVRLRPGSIPPLAFTPSEANAVFTYWASLGKRVLVYPAGQHAQWLAQYAPEMVRPLIGFGDRDPSKHGSTLLGRPVYAPHEIPDQKPDLVLIAAGEAEAKIKDYLKPITTAPLISSRHLGRLWQGIKGKIQP